MVKAQIKFKSKEVSNKILGMTNEEIIKIVESDETFNGSAIEIDRSSDTIVVSMFLSSETVFYKGFTDQQIIDDIKKEEEKFQLEDVEVTTEII